MSGALVQLKKENDVEDIANENFKERRIDVV